MIKHAGHLHSFTTNCGKFSNQQRLVQDIFSRRVLRDSNVEVLMSFNGSN